MPNETLTLLAIVLLPIFVCALGVMLDEGWRRAQQEKCRHFGLGDE